MNRASYHSVFLAFTLVAFSHCSPHASAQSASPAQPTSAAHVQPVDQTGSRAMTLDVVVTDKSGAPIKGLKPEDFKLLDNQQPQSLSVVEAAAATAAADNPVEAYVLIDAINPRVSIVASERRDLTAYLHRVGTLPVPTSLVFLTPDGLKIQGQSSRDPNILLGNLENNPTTVRTFHDTGYYSAEALREKCLMAMNVLAVKLAKKPGRKLVIWVSPGWGEFTFQSSRMSRKDQDDLFTYEVSISIALRAARITLYSVDPLGAECVTCSRNSYYKNYLKGPYSAKDADHNDLLLQALVAKTGGRVITGKNDIAAMIEDCLADAQSYYELTFDPPSAPAKEFHELRVEVDRSGLQARTRTGYYTLP